jgi:hyaluronoglucosaminidase
MTFGVGKDVKAYTLLMNQLAAPIKCVQLDKKGKVVSEAMIDAPYARIELANKNVRKIRLEGKTEIFEIVPVD